MSARRRAIVLRCVFAAGLAGAAGWGLQATVTTRQGINYAVSNRPLPVYVKILDFLHRDIHYRLLARQITAGLTSDEQRVLAVFEWTRRNIQRTPKDWPIVDDHILNIIIRGYGMDDQMADVFCTLATYAGVRAFWEFGRDVPEGPVIVLSFARVDGTWRVFDVAHRVVFRDPQGRLVDVDTLLATPALADVAGVPYAAYLERLRPFTVPHTLRAEQQMPWPRLALELRRALRLTAEANAEGR